MAQIHPLLNFNGKTEEAFNFPRSVFGGEFAYLQCSKDPPEADKVSEAEREKIMHVSLAIGGNYLMAADAFASFGQKVELEVIFRSLVILKTRRKQEEFLRACRKEEK